MKDKPCLFKLDLVNIILSSTCLFSELVGISQYDSQIGSYFSANVKNVTLRDLYQHTFASADSLLGLNFQEDGVNLQLVKNPIYQMNRTNTVPIWLGNSYQIFCSVNCSTQFFTEKKNLQTASAQSTECTILEDLLTVPQTIKLWKIGTMVWLVPPCYFSVR